MKKLFLLLMMLMVMTINMSAQKTYALITGVSRYQNSQANLQHTAKDVKSLRNIMTKQGAIVSVVTSKYANHDNIVKKLNAIVQLAKPEDKIIFFFSGHGNTGGFVTSDMKLFMYQELASILSKAKARQVICFIDACRSGSVEDLAEDNYSWAGSTSHPGLVFVMGCKAEESSYENNWVGHGLFTQALLKGLRGLCDVNQDKKITLIELFNYIYKDVTARTADGPQAQHPQLIGPGSMHDAVVASW